MFIPGSPPASSSSCEDSSSLGLLHCRQRAFYENASMRVCAHLSVQKIVSMIVLSRPTSCCLQWRLSRLPRWRNLFPPRLGTKHGHSMSQVKPSLAGALAVSTSNEDRSTNITGQVRPRMWISMRGQGRYRYPCSRGQREHTVEMHLLSPWLVALQCVAAMQWNHPASKHNWPVTRTQ